MSAAVQELYAGLPGALSTDHAALSDPAVLLDADPETSAFVLSCGSSLPPEPQRTYRGKICSQVSDERLDCTSKGSCPGLMELLPKGLAEAGGLAEDEQAHNSGLVEQDSLQRQLREAAATAKGMRGVAEECLVPVFLNCKETCWPAEKAPWLIQEAGGFLSRPPCVEIAASLQSLEESQVNVQVTTESLPSPMNEAQGMQADGPRLFSKAGESRTQVSSGVSSESSECSALDIVMAKAEVSEMDTLVSLEPVSAMDSALAKPQLQEEEDCEGLTTCSSSTTTTDVLSSAKAGEVKTCNQEAEIDAILDHCLPSQRDERYMHNISRCDSRLESKVSVDALLSDTDHEASDCLLKDSLEFGNTLWVEDMDLFEVVCEMKEEFPAGEEESLRSSAGGEKIELLEEWASTVTVEERLSPACFNEELSSAEQEVGDHMDHSYSCCHEGTVEAEKGDSIHCSWKETQGSFPSETLKQELQICSFAKEKSVCSENGASCLLDPGVHSSSEEHAEGDLRPAPSGIDNILKEDRPYVLPYIGSSATAEEENASLLVDVNHFGCFQNNCSTIVSSLPTDLVGALNCETKSGEGLVLPAKSSSDPRVEVGASNSCLPASNSFSTADIDLVADRGSPQTIQSCDAYSFTQQADAVLSSSGFLSQEEFPGSCAKVERWRPACLPWKEFPPTSQKGESSSETSENSQDSTALVLSNAEERMTDRTMAESKACCHSGQGLSDLCSGVRICCSSSKRADLDDPVLKETETKTKQVDVLQMWQISVSARTGDPSLECGGVETHDCLSHENCGRDLDAEESRLSCVCSVGVSSTGLSEAEGLESCVEAGNQRTDNPCVNAEEILEANLTPIYLLDTNLQQKLIKTSLREGPASMETVDSEERREDNHRNGVSEKLGGNRNVDITIQPLELGRFGGDQDKEGLERPQACSSSPTSSSPSVLSDLRTGLISASLGLTQLQAFSFQAELCSKDPGQRREVVCQRKIQAHEHQNHSLANQATLSPKKETLEAEGLECQQPLWVILEKQKEGCTVGPATHSVEDTKGLELGCPQSEWLCPASNGGGTPLAPVLLTENGAQEMFQQNANNGFSSTTESESTGSPSEGESIELKKPKPPSEGLERVSRLLTMNGFSKRQANDVETDSSGSFSQSVSGNPSAVLDKNNSPEFNYEPVSPPSQHCFHSDLPTLTINNSHKSTEGVCSRFCPSKEKSSLMCIPLGVQPGQNPENCWFPKDEPSASPALNALCCPPAKKHCAEIGSFERTAEDGASPLAAENEKAICSAKVFASLCKAIPTSMMDSKSGVEVIREIVTPISMDFSKKIKQPLEDDQREISLATEMKSLAVHSLPNPETSSGHLSQDLKLPLGGEETPLLFKAEIPTQPSFAHSTEGFSEFDLSKEQSCISYYAKQAVVMGISENMGHAWQSQDSVPIRSPGTLFSTVPSVSLGGSRPEASRKCFHNKGRSWQRADNDQELAGDHKKPSEYLVNKDIDVSVKDTRASETEARPTLTEKLMQEEAEESPNQHLASCNAVSRRPRAKGEVKAENLLKQRLLRIGRPLYGMPLKPEITTPQVFAVGHVMKGNKNKNLCGTLRESKRPKISRDLIGLECMEARNPSLSFQNCSQPSSNSSKPVVPTFCTLPQAANFGHHGIPMHFQKPRLFWKQPKKACKRSMLGCWKAARKGNLVRSSASLKNPSETVPKHKYTLTGSVCLGRQPAAAVNKGAVSVWEHMPKPRAGQSRLSGPSRLSECTKDPMVLKRLSVLASQLLPPTRAFPKQKLLAGSTKCLPLTAKCSQLQSQKLLEVFSCVTRMFNSPWTNGSRHCWAKMFSSQALALYPVESLSLYVLDRGDTAPFPFPFLPVSLHIEMGSMPTNSLMGATPLQGVPDKLAVGGEVACALPPSKWTFSFLLPQSCLAFAPVQEGTWLPPEPYTAAAAAPPSTGKDRGRHALAQRSAGFPLLGLQTLLALSSPGCYRFWVRKRNLASRLPAIQKLSVLPLPQGLKGLKCAASASADLFSPLPYSLGRVLSIWSQHGPSSRPSELSPLHPTRCKWQAIPPATTSLGLGNRTHIVRSSAIWPQMRDQVVEAPRAVNNEIGLEPSFPASLPTSCSVPEPAFSSLGLLAPEFQVHPLGELDASVPALPKTAACLEKAEPEKRPKKVSQIRIRKTVPKPDPNLTPMGLPRPKRLKKTEFSLEEIYTNKNYKSPPTTRCLETIFEEPKERNGSLISVSQQKRKRILEFQDFTIPRKRKARSRVKVTGGSTRAQKAALEGRELDVLLVQKLTDLEAFFAQEEEQEEQIPGS